MISGSIRGELPLEVMQVLGSKDALVSADIQGFIRIRRPDGRLEHTAWTERREFLGLVDFKGSGLVVKLPKARVQELIDEGVGQPFAPAGKVFKEWVSIPQRDRRRWRALLREGVAFVAPN